MWGPEEVTTLYMGTKKTTYRLREGVPPYPVFVGQPSGRLSRVTTGTLWRRGHDWRSDTLSFQAYRNNSGTLVGRTQYDGAGYPHESGIVPCMSLILNVFNVFCVSGYGISGHGGSGLRVLFVNYVSLAQRCNEHTAKAYVRTQTP